MCLCLCGADKVADKSKDLMITSRGAEISSFTLQPLDFCKAPFHLLFIYLFKNVTEAHLSPSLIWLPHKTYVHM